MAANRAPAGRPELAVVIPTRDRRAVLAETLSRLARHAATEPIEVIVIDDGSADGSHEAAEAFARSAPWPVTVLRQEGAGPATARNAGVRAARAAACLFIGDDSLPTAGLVGEHVRFHRDRQAPEEAALGLVRPAPPLDRSPFIRWLHEEGAQFGYARLSPDRPVAPENFWTSNISVKRELLVAAGGFDEGFPGAACEDAELGLRLAREHGLRLRYLPAALVLHFHPTDLARTLARMRVIGTSYRRLRELAPEMPEPSRPAARHRAKAAALTAALAARRTTRTRAASWRFLCDQTLREAYWDAGPASGPPRIGRALAALALRDPLATPPQPAAPDPA
ncbi:MAG TPA: glycosyltransferase [Solirubrobacterales bacterium]